METYTLEIETLNKAGRFQVEQYTIEARSETEATNLARPYKNMIEYVRNADDEVRAVRIQNNVTVQRQ